jgi:hypothetical protein
VAKATAPEVRVEVGDVRGHEVPAHRLGHGLSAGRVDVGDHHLGAGLGEGQARGAAESARATGDEGDLVAQLRSGVHRPPR